VGQVALGELAEALGEAREAVLRQRVEARLDGRLWILSNPVYLR